MGFILPFSDGRVFSGLCRSLFAWNFLWPFVSALQAYGWPFFTCRQLAFGRFFGLFLYRMGTPNKRVCSRTEKPLALPARRRINGVACVWANAVTLKHFFHGQSNFGIRSTHVQSVYPSNIRTNLFRDKSHDKYNSEP